LNRIIDALGVEASYFKDIWIEKDSRLS
jgi:hypothetical protein